MAGTYDCLCQSGAKNGIRLKLTNIRNGKGLIRIGVFTSDAGYPDKPSYNFSLGKDSIKNGMLRFYIPFEKAGPVSLSVLDDDNRNERMDYVFGIMPKEGFGFSNNPKITIRGFPPFKATSFNFTGGITEIAITMVYIR